MPYSAQEAGRPSNLVHRSISLDVVKSKIEEEIKRFRIQSFENYLLTDVHVVPQQDSSLAQLGHPRRIYRGCYELQQFGQQAVCVRVVVDGKNIKLYNNNGSRIDLPGLLSRLSFDVCPMDDDSIQREARGARARELQLRWWNDNSKSMRFLAFPAEIRNIIYEKVLGSGKSYCRPNDFQEKTSNIERRRYTTLYDGCTARIRLQRVSERSSWPLDHFTCNNQTFGEASYPFYSKNTFVFRSSQIYQAIHLHHPQLFVQIRHLKLSAEIQSAYPEGGVSGNAIGTENESSLQEPDRLRMGPLGLIAGVLQGLHNQTVRGHS